MDIEEAQIKKVKLEHEMEKLINKFQQETGLVLDEIFLRQLDFSSKEERNIEAKIETEIKL